MDIMSNSGILKIFRIPLMDDLVKYVESMLGLNEIIICRIYQHGNNIGGNACYLTNMGSIYHVDSHYYSSVTKEVQVNVKSIIIHEPFTSGEIQFLKSITFSSDHYSKIAKEINNFLNLRLLALESSQIGQ